MHINQSFGPSGFLTVVLSLLLYGSEVLLSELCHSLCMLVQMIACRDRGFSFTRALLGLAVDELHLCGDPAAVSIVDQILATTGDTFEVIISSCATICIVGRNL